VSRENVELVRRGVASVEVFWAMLDEHVVWDLHGGPMPDLDKVYMGRDEVIKGSRHYWGTWADYSVEAEEIIDGGPAVFVLIRERGRGKGSGAPFETRQFQVWTFRRGRIVRWETFESRVEALEAAGVSD
jgi:ketosteroid isomerase-like protein